MSHRGRFAPSPTGRMHLGNVRSALLGWLWSRSLRGEFLLRIEDLDPERSKPEFIDAIYEDLEWLGLTWDGPVWVQSQRSEIYAEALARLSEAGRAYRCWCSRAEVARAASAPHVGEEGPVYPGTCRDGGVPKAGRSPAWRFRVEAGVERFVDAVKGPCSQDVEHEVGDFLIQRIDGVASYQLAVVVDDALSGITHVLRGDDLLSSTARQIQLQRALGYSHVEYAHVPLMLQADGKRLAKRDGASTVAGLRELGWSAEKVIGHLAGSAGLNDGSPIRASELVEGFRV
ncbi:MAG: tRNA glutamyl-Q(34) synthetase GluQRS [Archangium sp.]